MKTELSLLSFSINEVCQVSEYIDKNNIKINGRLFEIRDGLVKSGSTVFRFYTLKGLFAMLQESNFIDLKEYELKSICQRYESYLIRAKQGQFSDGCFDVVKNWHNKIIKELNNN